MEKRLIGTSGIEASVIGLGTWSIGGWLWGGSDEGKAEAAVRTAIDEGVTLIDTAPAYGFGLAERIVGKAIKGRRDDVVLATKCGLVWNDDTWEEIVRQGGNSLEHVLKPESIRREVEASLRRLGTDYIDLYQTHWPDDTTPISETMETMLALKQEGKIRAIGVSNVSVAQMEEYLAGGRVDSDQEQYSLLDRGIEEGLLPLCREHNIAVLAYSPLAMGLLSGKMDPERVFPEGDVRGRLPRFSVESRKNAAAMMDELGRLAAERGISPAQLVLAWTWARPGITHVLAGARRPEHARENARAGSVRLDAEELKAIAEIAARHAGGIANGGW